MPALYVQNPTRQTKRFYYRLSKAPTGIILTSADKVPKYMDIRSGQQERIGGTLTQAECDYVVQQITQQGGRSVDEIDRQGQVVPFIYSIDKAVSAKQAEKGWHHNHGTLTKEGALRRQQGAIAAANVIDSSEVKLSIEQETDSELGGPSIGEGFTVEKDSQSSARRRTPMAKV